MMPDANSLLIIAGPTAVGKTEASLLLAQELRAEIVSADSMQIYRGMDVGTAKPTKEQRALVPHHMIDIVDPDQPYSVGDYLRDARAVIDRLRAAKKTPIVVGGTGLYIRALTRGLFEGPPADPELRERLVQRGSEGLPGSLYAELTKLDPEAAKKIHPNDLRRTIRALEVYYLRDKTISSLQQKHAFQDRPYPFKMLFLVRTREELYARAEQRVDRMIADGLEEEVTTLMKRGFGPDLPSMKALGYQHFMDSRLGKLPRDEALAFLKRDTKRYAKRQFTWFRREPEAVWVDVTGLSQPHEIIAQMKKYVEISNNLV